MGTLVIETAPGSEVCVEQLRHAFWFGAALANQFFHGTADPQQAAKYKQACLDHFNAAVTANALKWHSMEPRQGEVTSLTSQQASVPVLLPVNSHAPSGENAAVR
jgi:endo-1,4-beta-xylanase